MKKLLFICMLLPMFSFAQADLKHTVAAKESLTSIGRMYQINGRVLAEYNHIDYEKGLTIGQVLNIPASGGQQNPVRNEPVPAPINTGGAAIFHEVTQGEGLYGIGKKYNTTIEAIKQWNNLSSDGLTVGMRLIVGYARSSATTSVPKSEPEVPKPVAPIPEKTEEPVPVTNIAKAQIEGLFQSDYSGISGKKQNGKAGIFKSTSGWEDSKFYCLHDAAPIGSIIKISNAQNGKSIYAKVLDIIPELTENSNSILLVSNAGAASLGINNVSSFDCVVEW